MAFRAYCQSALTEPERASRIVAWVVTIALHVVGIAYLTRALSPHAPALPDETSEMRVAFITPAARPTRVSKQSDHHPSGTRMPNAFRVKPNVRPAVRGPRPVETVTQVEAADHASVGGGGEWSLPRQESSLALSEAPGGQTFEPNFITRPRPLMKATRDRLDLAFRDVSFGGRISGMVGRTICMELKAALAARPANAAVIVAAMEDNGCGHR